MYQELLLTFRFFVDDANGQQTLWPLKPCPQRWRYPESLSPITLQELLGRSTKLSLAERRKLAFVLACSLFLYHDSAWLSKGWLKEEILLFHQREDEPDLDRSFLSANFCNPTERASKVKDEVYHRNTETLALAILMVEIFNAKPIKSWRRPKDRVTANTNMMIADRVLKKMDDCPSLDANKACSLMDWIPESQAIGFDDEYFRLAYLLHVVEPLEREIKWEENKMPTDD